MEDDIDIYGDLDNEATDIDSELVKELRDKNAELEGKIEKLTHEFNKLREYCDSLETNISSLHKTARVEIQRKDRMIGELRQEVDNAAFHRKNFKIPKRINKPVEFPPPPREDSYYPETIKKEVNDTINREETTYTSPLNEMIDESEAAEQTYQPEKVPETLFGRRLKERLQREAEEEAEAAGRVDDQNSLLELKKPEEEHVENDNQYRLIPLTLKTDENSRKRNADDGESSEAPEVSDIGEHRGHRDNPIHENKRRKLEDKGEKLSSDRQRNLSLKSEDRRRLEQEVEYCCPTRGVNDESNLKRRHEERSNNRSNSIGRRSRNNGSMSRSRSRERRRERRRSRSPSRRQENGKIGKSRLDRREFEEERRERLRSSRRLRGREVSLGRGDSRERLGRRKNGNESRRNPRDTGRDRRRERIVESRESKRPDRKRDRMSADKSDDRRRKRSKSSSSERRNERKEICHQHENTMDALNCLEEGEIFDGPAAPFIVIPGYHDSNEDGELVEAENIQSIVDKLNCNLDDSIKEEKIENIEKFIMKMQKKDEEEVEENTKRPVEYSDSGVFCVDEKIEISIEQGKTILVNNAPVSYNSVVSKYLKKKRDSPDRGMLKNEEEHENNSISRIQDSNVIESSNSVDKISDCSASRRNGDGPEIADNNVAKNNVNTGNEIDNEDSKVETKIIRATGEKYIPDKLHDDVLEINSNGVEEGNDELKNFNEMNDKIELKLEKETLKSKSPKGETNEISKNPTKSLDALQPSRMILQQIASPTKAQSKQLDNPLQRSESKEKENSIKSSTRQQSDGVIVVARRRKVKLTNSSTSMTVVMSAKTPASAVENTSFIH